MDEATRETFDAFVRARTGELLRFGYVLTGSPDAAVDLVQDALERTLLAWPRVRRQDDPEGYVRRTMVNRNVSRWRRLRREWLMAEPPEPPTAGAEPPPGPDPELMAALRALPPRQRAVVVLRYYEDLSEKQTADVLGCAVGTVKSQTAKALSALRRSLPTTESREPSCTR